MKISFVVPNRNNLKYFKWSYDSIRKNQGKHEVWICSAVDACTDGTLEYYEDLAKKDPYFKFIVNKRKERIGHTILYNMIVDELVETEIAMIWHCDMYLCPGALDEIKQMMFDNIEIKFNSYGSGSYADYDYNGKLIKESVTNAVNGRIYSDPMPIKKRITSLTRIEPPLHPPDNQKIIKDFGTEPENFDEDALLISLATPMVKRLDEGPHDYSKYGSMVVEGKTTNGVFAPWAFWVDEFKEIGGHDYLLSPQSKEDDDIWNRFKLNGIEFIQTWNGFVYHMTCRGSRFNPTLTQVGKNSSEWEYYNIRSTRNYIRKWQSWISHGDFGEPIVNHKYSIGFILQNPTFQHLYDLEPWCQRMVCPSVDNRLIDNYIRMEQLNTPFDLKEKLGYGGCETEIIVQIDAQRFNTEDFKIITNLSQIITEQGEVGEFEIGNLKITIREMNTYEHELIVCQNEPINLED